jgi:hypothetical protein
VDEQIWTFGRNEQQLVIKRTPSDEGTLLSILGDGPPRTTLFSDLDRLISFQADFEKFLLATGWTFTSFSPDRRTGRERRHFSRLLTDRRRWWTDGFGTAEERERSALERKARRERRRKNRDLQPR